MKPRPILLLEINEVPWRVVERYRNECPNLRIFFDSARTFTTITVDDGELSPWVTWPSLHRGMSNREHRIFNLGQDPRTFGGKAIWDEYIERGLRVGVCGSMQSWPPRDPGPGGFFVPDTFAHDERCVPSFVEPLQRINLNLVRRNTRIVDGSLPVSSMKRDLISAISALPKTGIRMRTILRIVLQIALERIRPSFVARRPIFQTILFWDLFRRLFRKEIPEFSTFFTNHVAGVMHRYWNHLFPQDFPESTGLRSGTREHKATMDFAMKITDEILGDALDFQRSNPELILVFATSMGQAAVIRRREHGKEAILPDASVLLKKFGLSNGEFRVLLAMAPQIAFEISDRAIRSRVVALLESAVGSRTGTKFFEVEEIGSSLSVTLLTLPLADFEADGIKISGLGGEASVPWDDIGIRIIDTDPGTAYHVPEGILAICGQGIPGDTLRTKIPANQVKSLLMELGGISPGFPGQKKYSSKDQDQVV